MEYTVGVVGCGGMGKAHINWWNALDNCRAVSYTHLTLPTN